MALRPRRLHNLLIYKENWFTKCSKRAKQKAVAELVLPQMGLFPTQIEPCGGTLPDSNPVVSERLVYRLVVIEGNERFAVRLAEKASIDKDGYETTETFLAVGIAAPQPRISGPAPLNVNARLGRGYLLFSPGFSGSASGELIDCQGRAAVRFTRECRTGCTYMVRSTTLSAGIYWLRMKSNGTTVNIPMRSFE